MDIEHETWKLKIMLGAGLVFLVSIFFSYTELKYCLWGKTAAAKVYQARVVNDSSLRRRSAPEMFIQYVFKESTGQDRRENDSVSLDFAQSLQLNPGNVIQVQYIPGNEGASRLLGHKNTLMVVIFFLSLAAMLIGGLLFWLHIRQVLRETSPSRRR